VTSEPTPLADRWRDSMQDNYGTPPIALVHGTGSWVTDDADRRYLDLVGGIAVNALGHAHPAIVAAVSDQVARLGHTSNLAITIPALRLSERLAAMAEPRGGSARVFLCNSGAEANEAAFKLARLTGRTRMVAATGGFHGRTMGALALTGQPAKADPFRPLPGELAFVAFGDVEELEAAVDERTAAVILEPIQGEAGVVVPPPGYLAAARRITEAVGALLILDEVQTGVGRTGSWLAHQDSAAAAVRPDIITLAKGLGGGLPIGAMIRLGADAPAFTPGSHGSTFGGTRSARPRPWPCWTRSSPSTSSTTSRSGASSSARAWPVSPACGRCVAPGCWWVWFWTLPSPGTSSSQHVRPGSWSTRRPPMSSGSPRR